MKFSCLHNGFTVHVAFFSHCGSNNTMGFPLPNIGLPDDVFFVFRQFLPWEHHDNVDDAMAYETNSWCNIVRGLRDVADWSPVILKSFHWQEAQVVPEAESGLWPVYSASSVSDVSCIEGGIEVFLLAQWL